MRNQFNDQCISQQAAKRLFAEKIAHYAQQEPKHYLQLDGVFAPSGYDDQLPVDIEGDFLDASRTVELMRSSSVRVLIPMETHPKVAIRQLKKLAKLLKRKPELMDYAKPEFKDTQAYEEDDLPF